MHLFDNMIMMVVVVPIIDNEDGYTAADDRDHRETVAATSLHLGLSGMLLYYNIKRLTMLYKKTLHNQLLHLIKLLLHRRHRLSNPLLLIHTQWHMNRMHNPSSPQNSRITEAAPMLRLEVADRPDIVLIKQNRGTDARHNSPDSKWSRTLGTDDTS